MGGIASVVLVIHILVAIAMVGVILLQRSEGGALGIGGGSGSFLSARSAGNVLTRTTTILVVIFFLTSMTLTMLGRQTGPKTLNFNGGAPATSTPAPAAPQPAAPSGSNSLPALPGFSGGSTGTPGPVAPPQSAPQTPAPGQPAQSH